ncbi:MAG: carboxypeptidase-like regulatory domain-containing protein, partial [Bacteroidales bacterium]|nr:carboxypeptidase-like regulatory domain-containing protein [Bacteroidales bacterium]
MSKVKILPSLMLLVVVVVFTPAAGQTVTGRITNSDGNPVPFATLFVSELKHGTTANIKGEYQINLKPGNYTLYFQSLGYSPEVRNVDFKGDPVTIDVVLSIQYYEIPEVRVSSTGEDPAYYIMRRAIGLAPYYLNQVKHYTADVYIKGSMVIDKIPRLIKRNLDIENETIKEGEVYLIESVNEIEFNAPDRYSQKVIAQKSTFPEQGGGSDISPLDFVQASFYQPLLVDIAISPLAPNAMSHYNFKYEGSSPQGNYVINKIAVIPKRKSQQVFEGTIYIIEDYWCLHSLELSNNNLAGSIKIKQLYAPVEEEIWMPVTHSFDVSLSIVGVRGGGEYSSAVTYRSVEPNDELERPGELPALYATKDETIKEAEAESKPVTREQAKIEEILNMEDLTNRDMVRLSRLMQKEAARTDTTSNQLEIKQTTTYSVDENAGKRDSAYWNSIRPIPLSEEELRSIRSNDSRASLRPSGRRRPDGETDTLDTKRGTSFGRFLSAAAFGKTFRTEERKSDFRFDGFVNPEYLSFNSVDGLTYGTGIRFTARGEKGRTFILTPAAEWAFARERLLWSATSTFRYNRTKQSLLTLTAGRRSDDFNSSAGIGQGMNMILSLFWKENHMRLYESNYLLVRHRHEIVNGLYATLYYSYEDRKMLSNHSDFSIFRRDVDYMPNRPDNYYLPPGDDPQAPYQFSNHLHHEASIELTYTPKQKFYLRNGVKSPAGSNYPTFSVKWEHGLNTLPGEGYKPYNLITGNISDNHSIGALSEYGWKAGAGGFLSNEGATFPDFFHFNSQPVPVMLMNYRNLFMIPG